MTVRYWTELVCDKCGMVIRIPDTWDADLIRLRHAFDWLHTDRDGVRQDGKQDIPDFKDYCPVCESSVEWREP